MILPTVAAISQDALRRCRTELKEAAYGMGATRWEAILRVMLPTASTGIFGALVLGFGRALGETMALAMLVGNSNQLSAVAVLAGQHAGGAARPQLPRGRAARGRRCSCTRRWCCWPSRLLVNIAGGAIMAWRGRQRSEPRMSAVVDRSRPARGRRSSTRARVCGALRASGARCAARC